MIDKYGSTKFILCVAYMVSLLALAFKGMSVDEILKMADALKWGVLAYCGSRAGVEIAVALKGKENGQSNPA